MLAPPFPGYALERLPPAAIMSAPGRSRLRERPRREGFRALPGRRGPAPCLIRMEQILS